MDREPARSFEDLIVWQKAHAFVLNVYRLSRDFPREETYGLTSQLRRAAVSVPANIAEGFKRRGKPDKARLMNVAEGSLEEARYYLRLAHDLGYGSNPVLSADAAEIGRLLGAYARGVMSRSS
ncbi:MAG: four helix bundle protein [Acidimicrobiia bacterium]|nr:four helix bundle protein [Acidimicrobiia bacterium]